MEGFFLSGAEKKVFKFVSSQSTSNQELVAVAASTMASSLQVQDRKRCQNKDVVSFVPNPAQGLLSQRGLYCTSSFSPPSRALAPSCAGTSTPAVVEFQVKRREGRTDEAEYQHTFKVKRIDER